jgi:ADP-heptose:LPS heptosyltransferase
MKQPKQTHILVVRFSAMGDVAMAVPVVKAVLQKYPELHITFVSNAFLAPLFANLDRCTFHPAFTKGTHKGIAGIWKLYRELAKIQDFDALADLHNVLRSNLLRKFFRLSMVANAAINKGRSDKKKLTTKEKKHLKPLSTSHQRYADVFEVIGFPVDLQEHQFFAAPTAMPEKWKQLLQPNKKWIGVAPFAQHGEKMYPLPKMELLLHALTQRDDVQILFFGAPGKEAALLDGWQQNFPSSLSLAGKMSFAEELTVIGHLSMMLSMDSANMHLASIFGVPVVSIWGATHPFAGFYGWKQDPGNIVQISLDCRPCSVFGNKKCYRGDHACMNLITEQMILEKIQSVIQ